MLVPHGLSPWALLRRPASRHIHRSGAGAWPPNWPTERRSQPRVVLVPGIGHGIGQPALGFGDQAGQARQGRSGIARPRAPPGQRGHGFYDHGEARLVEVGVKSLVAPGSTVPGGTGYEPARAHRLKREALISELAPRQAGREGHDLNIMFSSHGVGMLPRR